jgi:hypothetical protein
MNRGTLAWRLYLLGVVQLALVAAALVIVVVRDAPPGPPRDPERQIELAASRLKALLGHPADLATELDELRTHGLAGSVYDREGKLLASNVTPPLARDAGTREPFGARHFGPPPWPPPRNHGPPFEPPPDSFPPGRPPSSPYMEGQAPPPPPPGGPPDRIMTVALGEGDEVSRPVLVARFQRPPRDLQGRSLRSAWGCSSWAWVPFLRLGGSCDRSSSCRGRRAHSEKGTCGLAPVCRAGMKWAK